MNGVKGTGFGTELLLLQCMVADSLFDELISEIEGCRLKTIRSRISMMWRPEDLKEELDKRLGGAIRREASTI